MKPCSHPCCPDKGPCRKVKPKKQKKFIRPYSLKRQKENKKYTALRKKFLEDHPVCEARLEGCTVEANQVHHKKGRIGGDFLDVKDFLAVCYSCHSVIEREPLKAKQLNLSTSRLT
jgi:hypothetical protein